MERSQTTERNLREINTNLWAHVDLPALADIRPVSGRDAALRTVYANARDRNPFAAFYLYALTPSYMRYDDCCGVDTSCVRERRLAATAMKVMRVAASDAKWGITAGGQTQECPAESWRASVRLS